MTTLYHKTVSDHKHFSEPQPKNLNCFSQVSEVKFVLATCFWHLGMGLQDSTAFGSGFHNSGLLGIGLTV